MVPECALKAALGSEERVKVEKSLKNKDFLIIFCRAKISSLCFIYIASMAAIKTDVIAFAIDYLTVGFI